MTLMEKIQKIQANLDAKEKAKEGNNASLE